MHLYEAEVLYPIMQGQFTLLDLFSSPDKNCYPQGLSRLQQSENDDDDDGSAEEEEIVQHVEDLKNQKPKPRLRRLVRNDLRRSSRSQIF